MFIYRKDNQFFIKMNNDNGKDSYSITKLSRWHCTGNLSTWLGIRSSFIVFLVNGGFTEWTEWSVCTVTCGSGMIERTRECSNPKPANNGSDCFDLNLEVKECTMPEICPCKLCCTIPNTRTNKKDVFPNILGIDFLSLPLSQAR